MERREGVHFSDGILQRVCLVSGAKNICDRITSRLDLWNKGTCKKLVQDSYSAVTDYLGEAHRTQTQEQRHCTYSNLILREKLREAV